MDNVERCGTCGRMGDLYVRHVDAWPNKDGICMWSRWNAPTWVTGLLGHPLMSNDDGEGCPAWQAMEPKVVNDGKSIKVNDIQGKT